MMVALINNEKLRIERQFSNILEKYELSFKSAALEKIIYGNTNFDLVFGYFPERYEYGKVMLLKGVLIQLGNDESRMYDLEEVVNFIESKEVEQGDLTTVDFNIHLIEAYMHPYLSASDWSWEAGYKNMLDDKYPWPPQ